MAWLLGIVATDGNICEGRESDEKHFARPPRLQITQKEPELLEKVATLMDSDAPLCFQEKRGIRGAVYSFETSDTQVIRDLMALGISPRKSRTLCFPDVPTELVPDFIRGCWDGDGTVYVGKGRQEAAAFGSGSRVFADSVLGWLVRLGLPSATLHEDSRGQGYWYFRFHGRDCEKLFCVLYEGTDDSVRLSRKHNVFSVIARKWQSH